MHNCIMAMQIVNIMAESPRNPLLQYWKLPFPYTLYGMKNLLNTEFSISTEHFHLCIINITLGTSLCLRFLTFCYINRILIIGLWFGVHIFNHEWQNYRKQCKYVIWMSPPVVNFDEIHTNNLNVNTCNFLNPMPYQRPHAVCRSFWISELFLTRRSSVIAIIRR